MKVYELRRETLIARPIEEIFAWFADAQNLETLTPPFLRFRILTPSTIQMRPGALIEYSLRIRGVPVRWRTNIETWDAPRSFTDTQVRGPYRLWHHTHTFEERPGGTWMQDLVKYALPFGLLGQFVHWLHVRRDVEKIFDYRTAKIQEIFGAR
ncbi:MAG: cyclase/dehydrase [Bryobacterales bacterium]|nr:cyclase/dehydrase [Bryobacterales bacterium]